MQIENYTIIKRKHEETGHFFFALVDFESSNGFNEEDTQSLISAQMLVFKITQDDIEIVDMLSQDRVYIFPIVKGNKDVETMINEVKSSPIIFILGDDDSRVNAAANYDMLPAE